MNYCNILQLVKLEEVRLTEVNQYKRQMPDDFAKVWGTKCKKHRKELGNSHWMQIMRIVK